MENKDHLPNFVIENVLKSSSSHPIERETVKGYDFNQGIQYDQLFSSFLQTGFQATNFALATQEINRMLSCRHSNQQTSVVDQNTCPPECTIFLGYTSNMVSCGVRESIRFLVEHKYVDVLVTTAGGVEEDLIKCFAPTILGSFNLSGAELRQNGLNRIGNLLVPNENYCRFEKWLLPILDDMVDQQSEMKWTPSSFIQRLGERIEDPSSIYYWAAKNQIPVFCPALTDGSMGDMLFFHTYKKPGLEIDLVADIRKLNKIAIHAKKTGMIVLGGGVAKHHTFNANLMRNGADFSVLVNTAQEYDGSDSGASPEEAISWGKIRSGGSPVKVFGDASILFPLLVSQTFAKDWWKNR
ncbi:deoxyhypusine synthase [Galdieria sulphuraria]|uniref:deoxyhypusine synthase n=1 Tax=Galdieria sulphuraria TaxID=130081 RepID=M2VS95_GALSU|nr:deoxyhypusine synthase [Galdieria sulphuraria]EME25991.1 deoxyhypusine synthase [Galdieria sulphuraria]|eukprot:XP_005702511.1 deoxyhypusine synthase [Galdieria sulphuraria]